MVFFQPFMFCAVLAKQMGLDLVDRIEFDQHGCSHRSGNLLL